MFKSLFIKVCISFLLLSALQARASFKYEEIVLDQVQNGAYKIKVFRELPSRKTKLSIINTKTDQVSINLTIQGQYQGLLSHGRHLYLWEYDTASSIPSGRRTQGLTNIGTLSKFELSESEVKQYNAIVLKDWPLDTGFSSNTTDDLAWVCLTNRCFMMDSAGLILQYSIRTEFDVVQIVHNEKNAFALVKLDVDDRLPAPNNLNNADFATVNLKTGEVIELLDTKKIPYLLELRPGEEPKINWVDSRKKLKEVLNKDMLRVAQGGQNFAYTDNIEGRIPWAQTYYVNTLMTLIQANYKYPLLESLVSGPEFENALRTTLLQHLNGIYDLNSRRFPWFLSKRYSLDREPITSIVHLGRLLALINRAERLGLVQNRSLHSLLQSDLTNELEIPNKVMERSHITKDGELVWLIGLGLPFWADGSEAPFNYTSAYVDGLLSSTVITTKDKKTIDSTIALFLNRAWKQNTPYRWNYSHGSFFSGWKKEDALSVNTPDYIGDFRNTQIAHVSYRTMDAVGLVWSYRYNPALFSEAQKFHFSELVKKGEVYPFTLEAIIESKLHTSAEIEMQFKDLRPPTRFCRATKAWESQNMVWCLALHAKQFTNHE